jgi:ribosome-associated protein
MKEFKLENTEFIPLCDLLKSVSLCQTGGHAKMVIAEGHVLVDGEVELRKRCKIRVGQVVEFEGETIKII